jgi:hypothetical protein
MFVWLNARRTETTKATKPRASPRSSAVPIRRTRPPARTHAAPKADAFSGHADGPVDGPESARRHLFSAWRVWHGRVVLQYVEQDGGDLSECHSGA